MGRKAKFDEGVIVKKGPGRKSKKQKDPVFPKALGGMYSISNSALYLILMTKNLRELEHLRK